MSSNARTAAGGGKGARLVARRTPGTPPIRLFTEAEWQQLNSALALTPRQCQIARLMCEGGSYKSIAAQTQISINTVRMHMRALFAKVGVHDRVGLILQLIAAQRRLAEPRRALRGEA